MFLYRGSKGIPGRIAKVDSGLGWAHVPSDGKLLYLGEADEVLQDGKALFPMTKGELVIYRPGDGQSRHWLGGSILEPINKD